ncbi:VanW family protein [Acinetobacter sp.]|jgi:vancomycin resistance protein VanW|uniref:VanW family protein n=1 Tax=Acinetobacter sp. TaxID=472 RepID=UPI002822CA74|nr:VanW family protein [Acinetobacter sp.]MDR0237159.1 VanW family protein [Acinetobacter sp.]
MKQYLPKSWKLRYQMFRRYSREHLFSTANFALTHQNPWQSGYQVSTSQDIKLNSYFENKTHNIDLVIQALNGLIIHPQQTFSFWHVVQAPTLKNGYKTGRNLVNGIISEDLGGGICQISCSLYLCALKAGLKIIERHSHSIDIYQEHERFTPLGSDATVVYGYKDLQFQNNLNTALQIQVSRQHQQLITHLVSLDAIQEYALNFTIEEFKTHRIAHTFQNQKHIAQSTYRLNLNTDDQR